MCEKSSNDENKSTKDKIIETAVELFAEKGYHAVSVRDIARGVGVKASSLYNHFSSKEGLLDTIFDIFLTDFGKHSFSAHSIEEGLKHLDLAAFLHQHGNRLQQMTTPLMAKIKQIIYMEQYRNERARSFVLNEMLRIPGEFYRNTFELAARKGLIQTNNPEMLALAFQYTMLTFSQEMMLRRANGQDTTTLSKKRQDFVNFICQGN